MSQAEYLPKRLPVLRRLATALRQIPAIEFALSRFRTLLRGRTNEEPPVANDDAADAIASGTVAVDVGDTATNDTRTIADDTDGIIVDGTEIAAVATPFDDLREAAVDEIAIGAAEAAALSDEDIAPPGAANDHTEQELESIAVISVALNTDAAEDEPVSAREALIRRRWKETGIMMWRGVGQSALCIQGSTALLPPKSGETMPRYDRLEFRLIEGLIVCEGFVVEPPAPLKSRPFARAA